MLVRYLPLYRVVQPLRCRALVDCAHAIAHNKVMIIDEARLVTVSFNFTQGGAIRNAGNLLVLDAPELAVPYLADYARQREHAKPV